VPLFFVDGVAACRAAVMILSGYAIYVTLSAHMMMAIRSGVASVLRAARRVITLMSPPSPRSHTITSPPDYAVTPSHITFARASFTPPARRRCCRCRAIVAAHALRCRRAAASATLRGARYAARSAAAARVSEVQRRVASDDDSVITMMMRAGVREAAGVARYR